jgi:hypothetical protein
MKSKSEKEEENRKRERNESLGALAMNFLMCNDLKTLSLEPNLIWIGPGIFSRQIPENRPISLEVNITCTTLPSAKALQCDIVKASFHVYHRKSPGFRRMSLSSAASLEVMCQKALCPEFVEARHVSPLGLSHA